MRAGFERLREDRDRLLGTWSQFADEDVIDLLGAAGYSFTIIDCEHGAFGIETAARLIRSCDAAGLVPMVRVPRDGHRLAQQALDSGAAGIVAPGVESAAEAAAWVDALRFAPGARGACPIVRAAGHSLTPWQETLEQQAGNGLVVLVETVAGVDAADEIAATAGLGGLMVGPFDLSASMGVAGQVQSAAVQAGLERVVRAAIGAGVPPWVPVFAHDPAVLGMEVARWADRGVRHFPIGADKIMFASAIRGFLAAAADRTGN